MTTDFRALCAELVEKVEFTWGSGTPEDVKKLLKRARAALADEPAVPKGREPVFFTGRFTFPADGKPSDEELALIYHDCCGGCEFMDQGGFEDAARAVLARWGNRQGSLDSSAPQPPADGEVAELVAWLLEEAVQAADASQSRAAGMLTWAAQVVGEHAELLQRQAPVPVAVSERWPEFSDCDDADRVWCWSWAIGTWRLNRINRSIHSHWLPAHALPLPEAQP